MTLETLYNNIIKDLDEYRLKYPEKNSQSADFTPTFKTRHSTNITLEDWNTLQQYVSNLNSDSSVQDEYLNKLATSLMNFKEVLEQHYYSKEDTYSRAEVYTKNEAIALGLINITSYNERTGEMSILYNADLYDVTYDDITGNLIFAFKDNSSIVEKKFKLLDTEFKSLVHKDGNEEIGGVKTFKKHIYVGSEAGSTPYVISKRPGKVGIRALKEDGSTFGQFAITDSESEEHGKGFATMFYYDVDAEAYRGLRVSAKQGATYYVGDTHYRLATEEYVNNMSRLDMQIVETLPTENISTTTIYLVLDPDSASESYIQNVYIDGEWRVIGNTGVNLNNYVDLTSSQHITGQKSFDTIYADRVGHYGSTSAFIFNYEGTPTIINKNGSYFCFMDDSDGDYAGDTFMYTLPYQSGIIALTSDLDGCVKITEDQIVGGIKTFSSYTNAPSYRATGTYDTDDYIKASEMHAEGIYIAAYDDEGGTKDEFISFPAKSGRIALTSDITDMVDSIHKFDDAFEDYDTFATACIEHYKQNTDSNNIYFGKVKISSRNGINTSNTIGIVGVNSRKGQNNTMITTYKVTLVSSNGMIGTSSGATTTVTHTIPSGETGTLATQEWVQANVITGTFGDCLPLTGGTIKNLNESETNSTDIQPGIITITSAESYAELSPDDGWFYLYHESSSGGVSLGVDSIHRSKFDTGEEQHYDYNFPNQSGTIALTSDIGGSKVRVDCAIKIYDLSGNEIRYDEFDNASFIDFCFVSGKVDITKPFSIFIVPKNEPLKNVIKAIPIMPYDDTQSFKIRFFDKYYRRNDNDDMEYYVDGEFYEDYFRGCYINNNPLNEELSFTVTQVYLAESGYTNMNDLEVYVIGEKFDEDFSVANDIIHYEI